MKKVVSLLIEYGANVHANDDEALRESASRGKIKIVSLLVNNGADIHAKNDEAFRLSVFRNHLQVFHFLLVNGAFIHAKNEIAFKVAAQYGYSEIVTNLIELGIDYDVKSEALYCSASTGKLKIVKLLIDNGAPINNKVMQVCIKEGHLEIVKYLLPYYYVNELREIFLPYRNNILINKLEQEYLF